MLKAVKISLKDSIVYGLGNIAVKLVGLILIPLYTDPKFFSVDDFGVLGMLEITGLVLTAFMASALPQSLTRWFWDKDYRNMQKGLFFMAISTQVVVSIVFCLALMPLSGSFSELLFSKTGWSGVISLVILASSLQAINNIINTLMRLQSRSVLYSVTNLLKLVIVLGLTLYFILVGKMGLKGIYLAQVIGNGFIVLSLLGYVFRNTSLFFDRKLFMSMNSYAFPLFLANIAAVALNVIDRVSLNSLDLLKSVALYTLAFKVTSVIKLVVGDSIKLAVGPMMFRKADSADGKRFFTKVLLYSSWAMMLAIIGISLFSYEAIKVMTKSREFWQAVVIIPILSVSIFFTNMKDVTIYGLHIAKKTRIIGVIVVGSTLFSIGLNILLIPVWGITGAAIATLLSQMAYWYATHYFSQKAYYVPYETSKLLILLVTGALFSFSGLLLNDLTLIPRLSLKTGLLVSFPFMLYLLGFYEPVEIDYIKGFVAKWSDLRNLRTNLNSLRGLSEIE